MLQRLERLTLQESKAAVTQTLDVVYGLANGMQVVMEGAHRQFVKVFAWSRPDLVDGKASTDDLQQALGVYGSSA